MHFLSQLMIKKLYQFAERNPIDADDSMVGGHARSNSLAAIRLHTATLEERVLSPLFVWDLVVGGSRSTASASSVEILKNVLSGYRRMLCSHTTDRADNARGERVKERRG